MNTDIVPFIHDYIASFDTDMGRHKPNRLESQSYARSAAIELLLRIKKYNTTPQIIVIEEFAKMMDEYSCYNLQTSSIFSTAHDVAMYFLDILLVEGN